MKLERYISISIAVLGLLFGASCEKAEAPIKAPIKGLAQISRVDMGEHYQDQIFFNFSTGQSVMTSKINSWDLAFEASTDGFHIFMNGGKDLLMYKTNNTATAALTEAHGLMVEDKDWGFDGQSGLPDSTYIGDWRGKNAAYIVMFNDGSFKKMEFVSVSDTAYIIKYGDINSPSLTTFTISKNPSFNYSYFSFENGGKQVFPEPAKNTWDIVFTRYRHIYYELSNTRYIVTGVLLNPHHTTAIADSITAFSSISFNPGVTSNSFSNRRDVVGFDWKKYNFTTGNYESDLKKCYVVRTQKEEYWKIRFINFYNANGVKGSPSFEYERIK
ncbi:MAG TPA: HmuY family protein [Flavipsychrobacter sp.]|nr:HmuY family protein [Flavipsychrobacter sp.]